MKRTLEALCFQLGSKTIQNGILQRHRLRFFIIQHFMVRNVFFLLGPVKTTLCVYIFTRMIFFSKQNYHTRLTDCLCELYIFRNNNIDYVLLQRFLI